MMRLLAALIVAVLSLSAVSPAGAAVSPGVTDVEAARAGTPAKGKSANGSPGRMPAVGSDDAGDDGGLIDPPDLLPKPAPTQPDETDAVTRPGVSAPKPSKAANETKDKTKTKQDKTKKDRDDASGASPKKKPSGGTEPSRTSTSESGLDLGALGGDDAGSASTEIPGTPGGNGDWMFRNGLLSPSCKAKVDAKIGARPNTLKDLPTIDDFSCDDSGTVTIPAPPGHYALDSWMESGPMGLPKWSNLMSEATGAIWYVIITVTVALFGALEWTMNLDLLSRWSDSLGQLNLLNKEWGMPLAAFLLTIGAIWLGIQARAAARVGDAMKQVGAGFFLMGLSTAIIANPGGTIGEITQQGSLLGTQAAEAPLKITDHNRTLHQGMRAMWKVVVEQPYGLLEFGDVKWANTPVRPEGELYRAALRIAVAEDKQAKKDNAKIKDESKHKPMKEPRVRAAKTNADLFLVWPANGDVRNSKDGKKCSGGPCLLNVLCENDDMKACKGDKAAYAIQRTDAGATDRLGQVLLIAIGMVSVWVVLGGIVFGLLWTSITVVVTLIELAFIWPLALSFKPAWRKKVSELQLRLVGAALAKVLFGIAAGMTMTMLILIRDLNEDWIVQWIFTVVAMYLLWQRREAIGEYMKTLTGGQETVVAATKAASRIRSTATGAATKFRPAATAIAGGGGAAGAAADGPRGGGVPTDLPSTSGPGRLVTLGAGAVGALAGPAGSAAAMAAVNHAPIGAAAGSVRDAVVGGAEKVAGGVDWVTNKDGARKPIPVAAGDQAAAVLATSSAAMSEEAVARTELDRQQELSDAEFARHGAQHQFDAARSTLDGIAPDDPGYLAALGELQQQEVAVTEATERYAGAQEAVLAGVEAPAPAAPSQRTLDAADAWLDEQAAAPTHDRDYRRLASVSGVSASDYDAMSEQAQEKIRGRVDASLRERPTWQPTPPQGRIGALTRLATGQPWRQNP